MEIFHFFMSLLKIITYGNPTLRKKAKPVQKIDPALRKLAEEMIETMHEAEGIGLAAPQVGKSVSLFVVDISPIEESAKPIIFLNNEILEADGSIPYKEGCLSIPGISAEVTRPDSIKIRYMDINGKTHEGKADGLLARVIQHETDHVNGKLFIDYLDDDALKEFNPILKKLEAKNKKLLAKKS